MKDFRGWDAVPDLVLILVITLVTICLLIVHVPVVYFGDAANNLAYSRHLIRTGQWAFTAHSDGQPHIPSTFVTTDNVHFHVRYPPGSMLVFATAELVCGEWGLRATNLLFGIAGIVLFYRTLLLLFPRWFAAAGAIALLLTPAYLFFMASYMTHPLSMFFILGAFYLVVRAPESNHPAWFAASAGLCIGAAVATRYINILILPLLGLSVIVPLFQDGKPRIRSLVVPMFGRAAGFALGAGVVMILLACYHTVQFGGPFITGYELAGETSPFNLRHFSSNLPNVTTLFLNYSGIAVPLALMGIYRLIRRGNILRLVVLVGWMSQFLLVYCFYFGFGQTTSVYNSRYLLPSWPPLIILSLYGLRLAGCVQTRYVRWAGAAIMSALHLYLVVPTTYLELQAVRPWKLVLARTIDALRSAPEEFPPGLRLFASPAVLLQLQVAFGDRFVFMPAPVGTGRTLKEFRSNGEAPAGQLEQMDVRGRVEISYNGLLRSLEKNEGTRALLVSSITPPPTVAGHSGMLTIETLWQTADDGAHLGIYGLNYQAKPAM